MRDNNTGRLESENGKKMQTVKKGNLISDKGRNKE